MSKSKKEGLLYKRKASALDIRELLVHGYINSWYEFVPKEVLDKAKEDFPVVKIEYWKRIDSKAIIGYKKSPIPKEGYVKHIVLSKPEKVFEWFMKRFVNGE